MFQLDKVSKIFQSGGEEMRAVDNVTLEIPVGSFLVITGRSGSGKSTLLYQLGLLDRPTLGDVFFDGHATRELTNAERSDIRLNKMGYIFQDYALVPSLTATENVALPIMMQGTPRLEAIRLAQQALSQVGLDHRYNNLPSQLSGGEQQRVSIARAVAHRPTVIFADEPTANLDTKNAQNILSIFKALHSTGLTVIMITHEKGFTKAATQKVEMLDGRII